MRFAYGMSCMLVKRARKGDVCDRGGGLIDAWPDVMFGTEVP